ncbi:MULTISPECIES: protealysin inhibitor emfourin [Streptomyces]|jgi:hypothetical protein|uniref:protealysin inhibitor emfourin n=1 Tax=Streptomyces TaxID=1883 RepID=UPI000F738C10|nr:protealysin inhibitor emfourin [Streptomyces sp. WAC05292]RSS88794.1 hypothetical protein EF903_15115 [Streptomyces sp. WAC05292]
MLITVTRTGGFAGRERSGSLDTEYRTDGAALEALAARALRGGCPPERPAVPDGFAYVLEAGGRAVELRDPYLTEDQRELIGTVLGEGA